MREPIRRPLTDAPRPQEPEKRKLQIVILPPRGYNNVDTIELWIEAQDYK